jgi:hypothetical protein
MSLAVSVGAPSKVFDARQRDSTQLRDWPDGILGRFALPSGTMYNWLGSNGGDDSLTVGSLYQLANPGPRNGSDKITIGGLPPGRYSYAAGGPVVQSNLVIQGKPDTMLLQVVHVERPNGVGHRWTSLGLARSFDNGFHWTWLGEIIQPFVHLNQTYDPDPNTQGDEVLITPVEVTGGPIVFTRAC